MILDSCNQSIEDNNDADEHGTAIANFDEIRCI